MKVIILIGLPGSGKSTYAKRLADEFGSGRTLTVNADSYCMRDGQYCWTPEIGTEAHNICLRRYIDTLRVATIQKDTSDQQVIVDNTNLRLQNVAPYVVIARAYGVEPEVHWLYGHRTAKKCWERNIHNVPEATYNRMFLRGIELMENWPKEFPAVNFLEPEGLTWP